MSTAEIHVSAPVYFSVGEFLNGRNLEAPEWVKSGRAIVSADKARALSQDGYADILSIDGRPYVWGACCSGDHNHA